MADLNPHTLRRPCKTQHFSEMISINVNKHDDHSVEFKLGFSNSGGKDEMKTYAVNTWIFIPGSLDIDPETYGKDQFYRDIKSNVRLITPIYPLNEIADADSVPLKHLRDAVTQLVNEPNQANADSYEYSIKMFAAIYKSSLRDLTEKIIRCNDYQEAETLCDFMIMNARHILNSFRSLSDIIYNSGTDRKFKTFFMFGDEYMSRQTDYRCFKIFRKSKFPQECGIFLKLENLLEHEREHKKKMEFETFNRSDRKRSSRLVHHYGMLKKFIESELYIKLKKKRDGFAVEQLYYSIAAGLAMIFATGVAWLFQIKYGNVTWPLFIALVISYMLKDRIKELMRYYFAHKRLNRYFDHKAHIHIQNNNVGVIKEGVDFISKSQIPEEVRDLRLSGANVPGEDTIFEERVLLYRNFVQIDHNKLHKIASYPVGGVNQILRLHINRFTLKMDNPEVPVEIWNRPGDYSLINVPKYYNIHIVVQMTEGNQSRYRHFCLKIARSGIISVK